MSETQDRSDGLPGGAGAVLRQARERAGLHIGALSVALKVPVQRLEALEADRFDLLPGPVFVRALALSVCRHLKTDPQQVLPLLPDAVQPVLSVEGALNEPFRSPSYNGPVRAWPALSRPAWMAALALVVAAVVVFFWPEIAPRERQESQARKETPDAVVVTEQVQPLRPSQPAPEAATAPTSSQAVVATGVNPGLPPPTASMESPISKQADSALLLFKALKPTWVEVIGPGGQVVLRRVIEAGEQVPVNAAPVLRVTVGNVGGVTVLLRGNPFDLSSIAQGNLARFEVQ